MDTSKPCTITFTFAQDFLPAALEYDTTLFLSAPWTLCSSRQPLIPSGTNIAIDAIDAIGRHKNTLYGAFSSGQKIQRVALNVGNPESLQQEANLYERDLREAQGVLVPYFYGMYRTSSEEGLSCLVMEGWEANKKFGFRELSVDFQMEIMRGLLSLHKDHKISYKSVDDQEAFTPGKICWVDGRKLRFVGFTDVEIGHECLCEAKFSPSEDGSYELDVVQVQCDDLDDVLSQLGGGRVCVRFPNGTLTGDLPNKDQCITLLNQWGLSHILKLSQEQWGVLLIAFEQARQVHRKLGLEYRRMSIDQIPALTKLYQQFPPEEFSSAT